jgi:hypothetical protein
VDLTLDDDPELWNEKRKEVSDMKAPTKLGIWHCRVLWMSVKMGLGVPEAKEYESHLNEFCDSYIVPASQLSAKKTYRSGRKDDMAQLSLRFMGIGTDRLIQTLKRSRGLNPATKKKGENYSSVPPHNFPQGKWKTGKTPRVTKGKVEGLHRASIAEACFTDTFETGDNLFKYGQVFVDYRSRFGDAFPIRSRKKIGWAFGEFCCRHYVPLILIETILRKMLTGL